MALPGADEGTGAAYLRLASSSLFPPIFLSFLWSLPDPVGFQTSVTASPVLFLLARSSCSHFAQTMVCGRGWVTGCGLCLVC